MRLQKSTWLTVTVLVVGLVLAFALAYFWPRLFPLVVPTTQPTTIADEFGALGAIFGLAAFVGVIATLAFTWVQGGEDQVRSEVFQLMSAWQDIVHNTKYGNVDGRNAFIALKTKLIETLHERSGGAQKINRDTLTKESVEQYHNRFFVDEAQAALGNYFRLLYHIIRYIDRSGLSEVDKKDLVRLIRAHLSEPELYLLFWNGLTSHAEKMYPLTEQYDLLQNFSFEGVKSEEAKLYPKTFERREKEGKKRMPQR